MNNREFTYFVGVLVIGGIIDFSFCFLMISLLKINIAFSVVTGFLLASLFNYYANEKFVFRVETLHKSNIFRYVLSMALILFIRILLIELFSETIFEESIHLSLFFSYLITLIINYSFSKFYIFRDIHSE